MTHHLPPPPPYPQFLKSSPHPILLITPIKQKVCTLNMKALLPCPTFSKIAAPNSTTTSSIINHHHYTSPNTQASNQTETKYLSSLKILTLNVRGVFTSQHDLKHMIATNTPDIVVLTETQLQKGNKPQPWLHQLLTTTNGGLPQTQTVVQLFVYANALLWQQTAHSHTRTRRVDTPLSS